MTLKPGALPSHEDLLSVETIHPVKAFCNFKWQFFWNSAPGQCAQPLQYFQSLKLKALSSLTWLYLLFSPFKWLLAEQDSSTIVVCALSGHNLSIGKQHPIKLTVIQNTSLKFLSQYVTLVILGLDEHQLS